MKRKIVTAVCVVLLICLAAFIGLLIKLKRDLTHKVYHGADAVSFISRDVRLWQQWQDCGLSANPTSVLQVTAAQGVLQSGSRFCVAVEVGNTKWAGLWQQLSATNETQLRDPVLDLCITGKQFIVSPRIGHDGPELLGVVESNRATIVTYYGYGGDG